MAVVVDNEVVARGLSDGAKRHGVDIRFLIECDTGGARNGVQSPQAALDFANVAMRLPNMRFEGLMTYPTAKPEQRLWLERALQLLNGAGIATPVVSGGGSPALKGCGDFPMLTEYRAGTYIYNDVMQVTAGAATWDDCAMTVRATVVSRPTEDRAVFDAGSKVMTYEQYYAKGYGRVVEYPDAQVTGFSEEHGILDLSACKTKPKIGEAISVIPNHCCVVTNMMDEIYAARGTAWSRRSTRSRRAARCASAYPAAGFSGPFDDDFAVARACGATNSSEHDALLSSVSAMPPNESFSPGRRLTPDRDEVDACRARSRSGSRRRHRRRCASSS